MRKIVMYFSVIKHARIRLGWDTHLKFPCRAVRGDQGQSSVDVPNLLPRIVSIFMCCATVTVYESNFDAKDFLREPGFA